VDLEKLIVLPVSQILRLLWNTCLQEAASGLCPEPDEINPDPQNAFL
jgi:hypothetical protein